MIGEIACKGDLLIIDLLAAQNLALDWFLQTFKRVGILFSGDNYKSGRMSTEVKLGDVVVFCSTLARSTHQRSFPLF